MPSLGSWPFGLVICCGTEDCRSHQLATCIEIARTKDVELNPHDGIVGMIESFSEAA